MKIKSALLWIALLILVAGCSGQAAAVTATPSDTPSPTVDAIGTGQALLAETQAAIDDALQATQAAFATLQADVALQATDAFATVEAASTLNTAIAGTYAAVNDSLDAGFATVEAAGTANAAEFENLAATAQALAATAAALAEPIVITATIPPTPTITATPTPAEAALAPVVLREIDIPALNLSLRVPEGMPGPQPIEASAVLFGTDAGIAPRAIIVSRQRADDLRGSREQSFVEGSEGDPVAVLQAALDDTAASLGGQLSVLAEPALLDNGLAPAAIARVQPAGMESEMAYVVVYLAEVVYHAPEEWLTLVFFGSPAELDQWIGPMVNSLRPGMPGAIAVTVPPTPAPVIEEADTAEAARAALGLEFSVPEGWQVTSSDAPQMARPSVTLQPVGGASMATFIGMVRASGAELAAEISGFPAEETDALAALGAIVDYAKSPASAIAYSGGRVNAFATGELTGAWTQLRSDQETLRLYLFATGSGEWLFIAASAPGDAFPAFSQSALRDVLASLAVRQEAGGVALGLDFDLPEGWRISPAQASPGDLITAAAVTLSPDGANPDQRAVILARGSAADFAATGLPAGEADPAIALAPLADVLREQGGFSGGRIEPFQLDVLPGAFSSLRNDSTAVRAYLFRMGEDDWLLVLASATRDAFNDFNRNELRTVLSNLRPAAGATVQTVTPIGPIEEVVVTHVSDGDTIYVMLNGVEESVRIIGVDTQEAHHPDSGAEWLGYAATHFIEQYITAGSTVWLESDIEDRDDFDRLLRYVWTKDENGDWRMLEADLIRSGLAHVRTYDEDRYVPYFHALEREAQAAGLGVWGTPPTPPVESLAVDQQTVWAINPDGDVIPMLFDAAALGNVPDPVAFWPNHVQAVVEDVYYVYPEDIDPVTGEPVEADKVGYWYWLEINDFRGWVPEAWILTEEPEWTYPAPETDIINYAEPFVLGDAPLEVVTVAGGDEVTGTLEPGSRAPVDGLGIDPATGDWWLRVDTQGVDGWVPLTRLSRMRPAG